MIYIKRTLWLLGCLIICLLVYILFIVRIAFIGFECLFLYIKNGNIQNCGNCLKWCIKLIDWYSDIEPKESEL